MSRWKKAAKQISTLTQEVGSKFVFRRILVQERRRSMDELVFLRQFLMQVSNIGRLPWWRRLDGPTQLEICRHLQLRLVHAGDRHTVRLDNHACICAVVRGQGMAELEDGTVVPIPLYKFFGSLNPPPELLRRLSDDPKPDEAELAVEDYRTARLFPGVEYLFVPRRKLGDVFDYAAERAAKLEMLETLGMPRLIEAAELTTLPAGATLLEEGDEPSRVMLLRSGEARVVVQTRRAENLRLNNGFETQLGHYRQVAVLGPGAMLGDVSMLLGQPELATVYAESAVEVLVLRRRDFLDELSTAELTRFRAAARQRHEWLERAAHKEETVYDRDPDLFFIYRLCKHPGFDEPVHDEEEKREIAAQPAELRKSVTVEVVSNDTTESLTATAPTEALNASGSFELAQTLSPSPFSPSVDDEERRPHSVAGTRALPASPLFSAFSADDDPLAATAPPMPTSPKKASEQRARRNVHGALLEVPVPSPKARVAVPSALRRPKSDKTPIRAFARDRRARARKKPEVDIDATDTKAVRARDEELRRTRLKRVGVSKPLRTFPRSTPRGMPLEREAPPQLAATWRRARRARPRTPQYNKLAISEGLKHRAAIAPRLREERRAAETLVAVGSMRLAPAPVKKPFLDQSYSLAVSGGPSSSVSAPAPAPVVVPAVAEGPAGSPPAGSPPAVSVSGEEEDDVMRSREVSGLEAVSEASVVSQGEAKEAEEEEEEEAERPDLFVPLCDRVELRAHLGAGATARSPSPQRHAKPLQFLAVRHLDTLRPPTEARRAQLQQYLQPFPTISRQPGLSGVSTAGIRKSVGYEDPWKARPPSSEAPLPRSGFTNDEEMRVRAAISVGIGSLFDENLGARDIVE